jgi:plastocyanin
MRFVNRCTPLAAAGALLVTGTVAVPLAGAAVREQPAAAAARKPVTKKVKVADDFYSPTKLTIKVGDKVNFVWSASNVETHNVTLISGPKGVNKKQFSSLDGSTNFHFQRTFTVPGKYHFQCTIHPTMMNTFVTVKK